ncbi:hypothetical protein Pelo_6276 [Pelomyxa schiedti]|nr:hypothetical protein Pelo_6276 [Pelomyxa schiedti]
MVPVMVNPLSIMTTALQTPERKVCNPNFPLSSVLEGAVIFGEHPLCITKRCMPYTYAVSTIEVAPRHPGRPTFEIDGQRQCDVLHVFVRCGDTIAVDAEVSFPFSPGSSTQDSAKFEIYRSKSRNVRYPDDPGVHKVPGCLEVKNIPGVGQPFNKRPQLTFKLKFASTIITAQATCTGAMPVEATWSEELV